MRLSTSTRERHRYAHGARVSHRLPARNRPTPLHAFPTALNPSTPFSRSLSSRRRRRSRALDDRRDGVADAASPYSRSYSRSYSYSTRPPPRRAFALSSRSRRASRSANRPPSPPGDLRATGDAVGRGDDLGDGFAAAADADARARRGVDAAETLCGRSTHARARSTASAARAAARVEARISARRAAAAADAGLLGLPAADRSSVAGTRARSAGRSLRAGLVGVAAPSLAATSSSRRSTSRSPTSALIDGGGDGDGDDRRASSNAPTVSAARRIRAASLAETKLRGVDVGVDHALTLALAPPRRCSLSRSVRSLCSTSGDIVRDRVGDRVFDGGVHFPSLSSARAKKSVGARACSSNIRRRRRIASIVPVSVMLSACVSSL